MSADTPAAVHDDRVREDHARSAKPDRPPPAERASNGQAEAGRPQQPAQTLNRADYNRARQDQPPIQRPSDSGSRAQSDATARGLGGNGDRRADHATSGRPAEASLGGHPRPDSLNRADYNQARHADQPMHQQAAPAEDARETGTERPDDPENAGHSETVPAFRHQEGEGQRKDLSSAGPAEAKGTDTTGERQDGVGEDSNAGRQAKPGEPEKVYVNGHEIEVTGNPADGLWIQGLPGEVPDKAGDVFASPEKEISEKSRGDKLFDEAIDVSDDFFDNVEKNGNIVSQIVDRPPTHAEVPVSVHGHTPETQYHAPEAGGLATGVLALGIVLWAGGRWIGERLGGAHDAGDR